MDCHRGNYLDRNKTFCSKFFEYRFLAGHKDFLDDNFISFNSMGF